MAGSQYFCVSSEDRSSEIWFNGLSYTPDHGTLFPLHEACIQISTRVVDYLSIKHSKSGRPCLLVELYNLLDAQWQDSHSKQLRGDSDNTGNDIFDLCQLVSNGVPRSVQAMSKLEWCGGDYDVRIPLCFRFTC